jgi:hypothetical protein
MATTLKRLRKILDEGVKDGILTKRGKGYAISKKFQTVLIKLIAKREITSVNPEKYMHLLTALGIVAYYTKKEGACGEPKLNRMWPVIRTIIREDMKAAGVR